MDKLVIGMGFGDEGKGTIVDFLAKKEVDEGKSVTVVRYCGGHQAGHQVVLPNGQSHIFSQFGSGTIHGAWTYHTKDSMFEPLAFLNERRSLERLTKYVNRIKVHSKCLVTIPLHTYAALLRSNKAGFSYNTCGRGIGETRHYRLKHGFESVFFEDLIGSSSALEDKISIMRDRYVDEFLYEDFDIPSRNVYQLIYGFDIKQYLRRLDDFREFFRDGPEDIWTPQFSNLSNETIIYESTQGVLLDEYYGTQPYTTWGSIMPIRAIESSPRPLEIIGVIRNHFSRHGDGPFHSDDSIRPINDHNHWNEFQGSVRYGTHDDNANYIEQAVKAIAETSCGRPVSWAVTHCDYDAPGFNKDRLTHFFPINCESYGQTWKDKKYVNTSRNRTD